MQSLILHYTITYIFNSLTLLGRQCFHFDIIDLFFVILTMISFIKAVKGENVNPLISSEYEA